MSSNANDGGTTGNTVDNTVGGNTAGNTKNSTTGNTDASTPKLICDRCKLEMTPQKTHFSYLGHAFSTDIPTCPGCGQVYIDEQLAKGRMAQVEMELEDK